MKVLTIDLAKPPSGSRYYIIQDADGSHIIEEVHLLLTVINILGAHGWIVQLPQIEETTLYGSSNDWRAKLVNSAHEELRPLFINTYYLRRIRSAPSDTL